MKQRKVRVMAKTNIQEKDTKVKSSTKKTKKVETEKIEKISQPKVADDVKVVEDNVQVDVEQSLIAASELAEIDLRSYNHSDVVSGYIRHKRSI